MAQGQKTVRTTQAPAGEPARVKVMALETGYYNEERKREGDVFTISGETHATGKKAGDLKEFSPRWMTLVPAGTREHTTPGIEMLRRNQEELRRRRAPESTEAQPGIVLDEDVAPTGDRAVLGS
jgi:hypothetical protein